MFGNATSPAITITNAGLSHCSRPLRRFASHCPAVHHQAHMRPRRIASKATFTKEGSHRSGTKVLDGKNTKGLHQLPITASSPASTAPQSSSSSGASCADCTLAAMTLEPAGSWQKPGLAGDCIQAQQLLSRTAGSM